jgi:hypothetical protein
MDVSAILAALRQASAFDLYRLRWAIDRQLDDPAWVMAVRTRMNVGMRITFYDPQDNAMRDGLLVAFRRKHAVVEIAPHQHWLVDYAAINLDGADADIRERPQQGLGRHEVRVGDIVGFQDRDGRPHQGQVIKLNDKTVTAMEGTVRWRVGYNLLHRLIEGQ